MFPIDNSTASTVEPTKKPVGIPGFFTAGTIGGTAATILEADWLNIVQTELLAILAAAAISPDKTNDQQVLAAIMALIRNNTRHRLSGALNLYVATSGSDTNDGLTPSTPFATPQAAWNYIVDYLDTGGYPVTINMAPGVYPPIVMNATPLGDGPVEFLGDPANPLATSIVSNTASAGAVIMSQSRATFSGLSFQTTTGNTAALDVQSGSICIFGNGLNFASCTGPHVLSRMGAEVFIQGGYTISGGASAHYWASNGGSIGTPPSFAPSVISLSGTPNFTSAFCTAEVAGSVYIATADLTFNGPATGQRYFSYVGGQIFVSGGGANYFPGSTAGAADAATYGVYVG